MQINLDQSELSEALTSYLEKQGIKDVTITSITLRHDVQEDKKWITKFGRN